MRLAADDAQVERLGDAQIAGEIVGRHRLLQPVHVVVLKFSAHLDGDVGGPAHVDVDHDGDVRSHRLAHTLDVIEVGGEVGGVGDLHLDRLVAALFVVQRLGDHAVAAGAAEAAAAVSGQLACENCPHSRCSGRLARLPSASHSAMSSADIAMVAMPPRP